MNAIATPRANGQVERVNRTLTEAITASAETEVLWDETLPQIAWGINNTVHSTTKQNPSDLMFAFTGGAVYLDLLARSRGEKRALGENRGRNTPDETQGENSAECKGALSDNCESDEDNPGDLVNAVKRRRTLTKQRLDAQAIKMRKVQPLA